MSVSCKAIIAAIEALAPKHLVESWDNIGLLLGQAEQQVKKVLVTLDVSEAAVAYAAKRQFKLIVAHHPLIFKGLTNIRTDTPKGKLIAELLKNDIVVYAAHTNLDSCSSGISVVLATSLGLNNIRPLSAAFSEKLYKLVVFVPKTHADIVQNAISEAGAGHIGNYSHCAFRSEGKGTFRPLAGAKPYIGAENKLEVVEEIRLETILPAEITNRVLQSMLHSHPYEEVAYDLYLLENKGNTLGLGRIGSLPAEMTLLQFGELVKQRLDKKVLKIAGELNNKLSSVAVCGGSGASLIKEALSAGAEVLVTGDVSYHAAQEAVSAGLAIIDAGHFATEVIGMQSLAEYLADFARQAGWQLSVEQFAETDVFAEI